MAKEFKLPDLGEGIHEGEIVEILVSVGDRVVDGQPIMLVETDKATTEIPSPVDGVVKEIRVKPGDLVKVGQVLMTFSDDGEKAVAGRAPAPKEEARVEEAGAPAAKATEKPGEKREKAPAPKAEAPPEREGPVPAAPSTRRLARELGVDLRRVTGSGPGGRVTSEDVREFAEKGGKAPEAAREPEARVERAVEAPPAPAVPPLPRFDEFGPVEKIPLRSVRRATARHMALAWSQIPHVTHQDVADITDLEAFRLKYKGDVEAKGGALSLTVFVLKAAVAALKAFPRFNSSLDMEAEEIVLKHYYNIGVAVDSEKGLIVPVIRDVDRKSLTEVAVELRGLAERTREGKADRDEMAGGTFTVTNIGPLGGTGFTPIVNYPQVAILGMAQARLQPVIQGDLRNYKLVPRLMLPLILGFDHRVVDGADAARFLGMIIESLQNPEKLMMVM
ncbi:dihydrolipoamide acetyltransferase family protein [Desulforhabdus amnigena]|jgi:pyruvate dehydrogenase E2 component (dihydrolipoamide acetyltransferase)|uniref:Dihydrolipoamide acetyltransferase component of pyruvate dehydrogenase complex n=1 Tax=Desulforhabdus amnigena TaxID=40218 RepID=A0A9W6L9F3_9BACT|nr:dihydrolipoamide acetyltransferase family protein [Desulforhabdus amnigena]NLJ28105.1 2-oxo acid dehydrogenase subunit E2 [Deltaproteobacteria bacterium]GLI35504.1 dihydrolipoamide acetyltransferase component of pyruvate dehydrogenase complex [Desulforhabdus amnigena]